MIQKLALTTLLVAISAAAAITPVIAIAIDFDTEGTPSLRSAGALAFSPDGVLFVADSRSASIFALDTSGTSGNVAKAAAGSEKIAFAGVAEKIAALAGTTADQIQIHDLAIHPTSKKAYLSATRGQGDDALPVIARVASGGGLELLSLDNIRYSSARIPNPPGEEEQDRRGNSLRMVSITDMAYLDGRLLVTGLSNEEFASKMRVMPFPFEEVGVGTSIEVYHGAHGRWETNAPVRTLTTYDIEDEPHVLAAYTCTPLVKFPLSELLETGKIVGTTVAELGNRNRPLDMIVYSKGGQDYLLMNNSSRGVMKVELAEVDDIDGITERIADTAGLPYETIEEWTGVQQLDKLDDRHAVLLVEHDGRLDLETVALP